MQSIVKFLALLFLFLNFQVWSPLAQFWRVYADGPYIHNESASILQTNTCATWHASVDQSEWEGTTTLIKYVCHEKLMAHVAMAYKENIIPEALRTVTLQQLWCWENRPISARMLDSCSVAASNVRAERTNWTDWKSCLRGRLTIFRYLDSRL